MVLVVYGFELVEFVMDCEYWFFGQDVEIFVGDDGGDFQDGIGICVEVGYFQIDLDQVVFVGLVYVFFWVVEVQCGFICLVIFLVMFGVVVYVIIV